MPRAILCLPPDLLLLAAWPVLLLVVDLEWVFTPLSMIDPWLYFGTFVNLEHHLEAFAGTYYISRLSWILPGSLVHAVLPPVPANVALHLATFYAGTFGCYACLRLTVGRRPAVLGALLLGAHQAFLDAVGWDYVDGAGIAYFLLALACGTAAARIGRPLIWSAASGMFAAACVITNVAWLLLIPGYLIYLAVLSPHVSILERARRALAMGAGAAAAVLACALVYAAFTGSYWFFLANAEGVRLVGQSRSGQSYEWMWTVPLLGMACALLMISLMRLILLLVRRGPRSSIALQAVWIWSAVAMLTVHVAGVPILSLSYYASYLLPGIALAAGDLLARPVQQLSTRAFVASLGVGAGVWLFVFGGPGGAHWPTGIQPFILTGGLVALAGILLSVFTLRWFTEFSARAFRRVGSLGIVAGLACVLLLMLVQQNRNTVHPGERQRNYQLTVDALDRLARLHSEKPLFFWYSDDAPRELQSAYLAISASYLWGYRLFSAKFPARTRPDGHDNDARSGRRIVLMTDRRYRAEEIERMLSARIQVVREMRLMRGGVAFSVMVFDIR